MIERGNTTLLKQWGTMIKRGNTTLLKQWATMIERGNTTRPETVGHHVRAR